MKYPSPLIVALFLALAGCTPIAHDTTTITHAKDTVANVQANLADIAKDVTHQAGTLDTTADEGTTACNSTTQPVDKGQMLVLWQQVRDVAGELMSGVVPKITASHTQLDGTTADFAALKKQSDAKDKEIASLKGRLNSWITWTMIGLTALGVVIVSAGAFAIIYFQSLRLGAAGIVGGAAMSVIALLIQRVVQTRFLDIVLYSIAGIVVLCIGVILYEWRKTGSFAGAVKAITGETTTTTESVTATTTTTTVPATK